MDAIVRFSRIWEEGSKGGRKFLIFGTKESEEPLKKKVFKARYLIEKQIDRIGYTINKLKERDERLFNKLVDSIVNHDELRAKILASEIAEIRKIAKTLMTTQLALERVKYRMELFLTIGDVATTLAPVVPVLGMLKAQLLKEVPELGIELSKIHEELEEAVDEMSFYGAAEADVVLDREARKILEEARTLAERQVEAEFPSVSIPNTSRV
ncbi:Snf7 family protein [Ignicoccus hospitalis]|uniref:Conserved protein implicated in secretion-like protein n=1 Tax=Ignicoccus hospitalis (strain KIN4/I / DSM 18386 / JCM 14125) TaxID=453591 RepID=A8ABN1_IGNH4|nr:Snf7 family protein [Ignicoccus hospitalis]ABU82333.1 Conserved protein implicated in secretion-like protein [Ignicoccus hospitalis KIN4/I]HIH89729.1 hypothetical protein [Desulfurococcaceae archaeon]